MHYTFYIIILIASAFTHHLCVALILRNILFDIISAITPPPPTGAEGDAESAALGRGSLLAGGFGGGALLAGAGTLLGGEGSAL